MKLHKIFILAGVLTTSLAVNAQSDQTTESADVFSTKMVEVLGLTAPERIMTIQDMNGAYERSVNIATERISSGPNLEAVIGVLDKDRNNRLKEVLTADQFVEYLNWRESE